jgi:nucleoside-diphosphate-sugar epimerase
MISKKDILLDDANKLSKIFNLSSELNKKKILVTGASGLIGLNFLSYFEVLVEKGAEIIVTGITNTSYPNEVENLFPFLRKKSKFYSLNLTNTLEPLMGNNFDIILHCASYGQPGKFMAEPISTIQLNTSVLIEIFKLLKPNGKLLYLSSSEIYSGNNNSPHKENDIGLTNPSHLRASYIEAKRCGETICNIHRNKGINAVSARVALSYGPGAKTNDHRVLNQFIIQALNFQEIRMLDNGLAIRTYCYIRDTIEILLKCLFLGKEPVYNVAGQSTISIFELAQIISNKLGVKITAPKKLVIETGAPHEVRCDISKIMSEFKKNSFISLNEGIVKTIDWFKSDIN